MPALKAQPRQHISNIYIYLYVSDQSVYIYCARAIAYSRVPSYLKPTRLSYRCRHRIAQLAFRNSGPRQRTCNVSAVCWRLPGIYKFKIVRSHVSVSLKANNNGCVLGARNGPLRSLNSFSGERRDQVSSCD